MMLHTSICLADDRPIPVEMLPAAAKVFVQQHFPQQKMVFAVKDGKKYEVHLDDGTQIDFDRKGNWDKVDCQMRAVPDVLVPPAILQYVNTTFPEQVIVKIDKERYGYEIELGNDFELKFNKQGIIKEFDD